MAILYKNRFDSGLGDYTLVQTGSTITIVSGEMDLHQTDTSNNTWNRIRATLTSATAAASGQVCYLQFRIPDLSLSEDMMICTFADTNVSDFTNTDSARATGNVVVLYDDNVGNVGSFAETQNTTYDLKMELDGSTNLVLSIRASNSVGNLPAGTGSYTSIGTSTTAVPATYHLQHNLKTLNPNTDLFIDEVYITNDGTFSPTAPSGVSAAGTDTDEITVSFTDNGTAISETGIKVERSINNVTFTQVGTVAQGVGAYVDTGLDPATKYYYKIRGYITIDATDYNSAYSSTVNATTLPNTPSDLEATAISTTEIDLEWVSNNSNVEDSSTLFASTGWTVTGGTAVFASPTGCTFTKAEASGFTDGVTRTASTILFPGDVITVNWKLDGAIGNLDQSAIWLRTVNDPTSSSGEGIGFRINDYTGTPGVGSSGALTAMTEVAHLNATQGVTYNLKWFCDPADNKVYLLAKVSTDSNYTAIAHTNAAFAATAFYFMFQPYTITSVQSYLAFVWSREDIDGFKIDRSLTSGSGFSEIDTTASNVVTFSDSGLDPGTTYYYKVRAYKGAVNSAYSNEANATTDSPPSTGGDAIGLMLDILD